MDIEWGVVVNIVKEVYSTSGLSGLAILLSLCSVGYTVYRVTHLNKKVVNMHRLISDNYKSYQTEFAKAADFNKLNTDFTNVKEDIDEMKSDLRNLQDRVDVGFDRMADQISNLQNTLLNAFSRRN